MTIAAETVGMRDFSAARRPLKQSAQTCLDWKSIPVESRVSLIRDYVREGLSLSDMSVKLSSRFRMTITRNTIAGFCYRHQIKLNPKASGTGPMPAKCEKPRPQPARKRISPARPDAGGKASSKAAGAISAASDSVAGDGGKKEIRKDGIQTRPPDRVELAPDGLPMSRPTSILEISAGQCRTPIFERATRDPHSLYFCGAPALPNRSYCARCREIVCASDTAGGPSRAERKHGSRRLAWRHFFRMAGITQAAPFLADRNAPVPPSNPSISGEAGGGVSPEEAAASERTAA